MITGVFIAALLVFSISACGQDDDQREFEREAFSLPDENITETDGSGKIINENPDDWRTAPFFQGLVFVNPPFPNPVQTVDQLRIDVQISGFEAVSGLTVVLLVEGRPNPEPVFTDPSRPLPPGLTTITINPIQLGRFGTVESARGYHRLILLDGRDNVISYGNVKVE